MTLLKTVITHVFGVLGRAFWPSLVIALLASFFYLYCTDSTDAGKGFWAAARGWVRYVRTSSFFRKILALCFYTSVVLYSTLIGRAYCANPLSYPLSGWQLWVVAADGGISPVMSGLENVAMLMPFTFLLAWMYGERPIYTRGAALMLAWSAGLSLAFSFCVEGLQFVLHLGTWQLADIVYNTLGGALGGLLWWALVGRARDVDVTRTHENDQK